MKQFGNKVNKNFFDLPKYAQYIISWVIIIGLLWSFFWLNSNYLHLPLGGGTEECSGTFETNCGDIEDMQQRLDKEPPMDRE